MTIPALQEMASVLKENCHDHAFRILWVNTLPLEVTSKQRISLVTELLPRPAVGHETGCHPLLHPALSDRDASGP
jgi:hypothetical protein